MELATLNCFTKRERSVLTRLHSGESVTDNIAIDPKKLAVAKHFHSQDWDIEYFRLQAFSNALVQLAEYNTCRVPDEWVWFIPHTPTSIAVRCTTEMINIKPVAHPARLKPFLELIYKTPLSSIDAYCEILEELGHDKIKFVASNTADKNGYFTALSWVAGPFSNTNIIYLNRNKLS
ncbi:hypothetical protein pEaSNUABM11_00157 [Erwinia phage pEa_SNUABM_11]|nr:hypothetical protein pEaSNUABM11_00157 [Erwinia phage pEa_SNUABM_11]